MLSEGGRSGQLTGPGGRNVGRSMSATLVGFVLAAVCLALAVALLLPAFKPIQAGSVWLPPADRASQSRAVLLLYSAATSEGSFHLLQESLAAAGFASRTQAWPVISPGLAADDKRIQEAAATADLIAAAAELAAASGCDAGRIVVVAFGSAAGPAFRCYAQYGAAGLLLVVPSGLDQLTAAEIDAWPADQSLTLYAGQSGDNQADRAEWFFERLTGEDATAYPAYQRPGLAGGRQYRSIDGRVSLTVYPALYPNLAALSLRLVPNLAGDLAGELADAQASPAADPAATLPATAAEAAAEAARQLSRRLFAGLLAILFLLLAPLILNDRLPPIAASPAAADRTAWLKELLLWLPAVGLAVGLALGFTWLADCRAYWPAVGAALLPGCRGLMVLLARLAGLRTWAWTGKPGMWAETAPSAAIPVRLAGIVLLVLLLCLLAIAIRYFLGALVSPAWSPLLLPGLILLNLPCGFAGVPPLANDPLRLISRYLPYLLLPIILPIFTGWPGLAAGLLILLAFYWSANCGKAAARLSGLWLWGGLIQSIAYSLLIFLPGLTGNK